MRPIFLSLMYFWPALAAAQPVTMEELPPHIPSVAAPAVPPPAQQVPMPPQQPQPTYIVPPAPAGVPMYQPLPPGQQMQQPTVVAPAPSITAPIVDLPPQTEVDLRQSRKVTGGKDMIASLLTIDKVYARSKTLKVPVGNVAQYGEIEMLVKRCVIIDPGEKHPQLSYAALLEIYDRSEAGSPQRLFAGWMYSDSPSVSALEHPHYDVAVVKCTPKKAKKENAAKEEKPKAEKPIKN